MLKSERFVCVPKIINVWNPNVLKSELAFVGILALSEIRMYGFQTFTVKPSHNTWNLFITSLFSFFRKKIFRSNVSWKHPLDCSLLIPHGLVGNRNRKYHRNSFSGKTLRQGWPTFFRRGPNYGKLLCGQLTPPPAPPPAPPLQFVLALCDP